MSNSKHTQGKWEIGNKNYIQIDKDDPLRLTTICAVFGGSDEDNANARLIAAAPEMLEFLLSEDSHYRDLYGVGALDEVSQNKWRKIKKILDSTQAT